MRWINAVNCFQLPAVTRRCSGIVILRNAGKPDLLGHCGVLIPQVAVKFHCQCAAVFVVQPAGDGRDARPRWLRQ